MGGWVGGGWESEYGLSLASIHLLFSSYASLSRVTIPWVSAGQAKGTLEPHPHHPLFYTLPTREYFIGANNKEDIVSFAEPTLLQGMRQNINYWGEKSHFIQSGNVMRVGWGVRGMNVDVSFSWSWGKKGCPSANFNKCHWAVSFPRGLCLFSLLSILIGNWNHCWRKVESPPPLLCPWNIEPQVI